MFCYFWGKGNGWFHDTSIDFKVSGSFSLLYNVPDLIFKPRRLQMQIAMFVSELEAQKRSQLFTVFWGETVQLWRAQQHCLRQSYTPFSQTHHPFCGLFTSHEFAVKSNSTLLFLFPLLSLLLDQKFEPCPQIFDLSFRKSHWPFFFIFSLSSSSSLPPSPCPVYFSSVVLL